MKTIGLLGGMSWESTVTYYQIINETIKHKLGGYHSAKIILYSVDFAEIEQLQSSGEWNKCAIILSEAALSLEKAGADFLVICTNTMHKVAEYIQSNIRIPIVHIAEVTADELHKNKIKKAVLLGTKYTMTQTFYKNKINDAGIDVLIPNQKDIEIINSIIYDELCLGVVAEQSKQEYLNIISKLAQQGAEGVVLGCTEIGLLIQQQDIYLPVFDTTRIHAMKAAMISIE